MRLKYLSPTLETTNSPSLVSVSLKSATSRCVDIEFCTSKNMSKNKKFCFHNIFHHESSKTLLTFFNHYVMVTFHRTGRTLPGRTSFYECVNDNFSKVTKNHVRVYSKPNFQRNRHERGGICLSICVSKFPQRSGRFHILHLPDVK